MRKATFSLICILCIIMCVSSACSAPKPNTIINRCSKAWRDMSFDTVSNASPKDCSWLYWQFFDNTTLLGFDDLKGTHEQDWLPESGYFIAIGSIIILYDNNENEVGYYLSDSGNVELFYTYKSGRPTVDQAINNTCQSGFKLLMANQDFLLSANSLLGDNYIPASEYNTETDTKYCRLSEQEILRIK